MTPLDIFLMVVAVIVAVVLIAVPIWMQHKQTSAIIARIRARGYTTITLHGDGKVEYDDTIRYQDDVDPFAN